MTVNDSDPPKPVRRWYQFSLRTLLLVMTVFAVWLGIKIHQARQQKQAVAAIEKLGGTVYYDYQVTTDSRAWSKARAKPKPPGPACRKKSKRRSAATSAKSIKMGP